MDENTDMTVSSKSAKISLNDTIRVSVLVETLLGEMGVRGGNLGGARGEGALIISDMGENCFTVAPLVSCHCQRRHLAYMTWTV